MKYSVLPIKEINEIHIFELLDIRNLWDVRCQMFDIESISRIKHELWVEKRIDSFGETDESYLILNSNGKASGFFRYWFDMDYGSGNWSMYTDTRVKNSSLGVLTEYLALKSYFKSRFASSGEIISEVKPLNPILSLHKKFGFTVSRESHNIIIMRLLFKDYLESSAKVESTLLKRFGNL